jgi:hypothetical protein
MKEHCNKRSMTEVQSDIRTMMEGGECDRRRK